jgi:hypothetical protein
MVWYGMVWHGMAYAQTFKTWPPAVQTFLGDKAMQRCSLPPKSSQPPTIRPHFSGSTVLYRFIEADKGALIAQGLEGHMALQHLDVTQSSVLR